METDSKLLAYPCCEYCSARCSIIGICKHCKDLKIDQINEDIKAYTDEDCENIGKLIKLLLQGPLSLTYIKNRFGLNLGRPIPLKTEWFNIKLVDGGPTMVFLTDHFINKILRLFIED